MEDKEGVLKYDAKIDRLVLNDYGLHCGDEIKVKINDTWVPTRVEASSDWSTGEFKPNWYLVGLEGLKIEGLIAKEV